MYNLRLTYSILPVAWGKGWQVSGVAVNVVVSGKEDLLSNSFFRYLQHSADIRFYDLRLGFSNINCLANKVDCHFSYL